MAKRDSATFQEVFDLIQDYAGREGSGAFEYHVKALDLVAGTYRPRFESPVPPDARQIVEDILEKYDYTVRTSGLGDIDDTSVAAVVNASIAAWFGGGDAGALEWGIETLSKMLRRVARDVQEGNYASLIAHDIEVISAGLQQLGALAQSYLERDAGSRQ
jgi:hypothetical protein